MIPYWVDQAKEALNRRQLTYALELIETHAFEPSVSDEEKLEALVIVDAVAMANVALDPLEVRARARAAASRLEQWRRRGFAEAEAFAAADAAVDLVARRRAEARVREEQARAREEEAVRAADLALKRSAAAKKTAARWKRERPQREAEERRIADLVGAGFRPNRAAIIAEMESGPYEVLFHGVLRRHDEVLLRRRLVELGYAEAESERVLERVIHIAPEVLAAGVDQSPAVRIQRRFEAAGGRIKIREGGRTVPLSVPPPPTESVD